MSLHRTHPSDCRCLSSCRHKHKLDKEDEEHKTPLQYLSAVTKLSSVKALTSVDQDDKVKQTDVYSDAVSLIFTMCAHVQQGLSGWV